MSSPWADLVAAADPSLVLPVRPRGAAVEVAGPLALVDLVDLGGGHGVGVVQAGDGNRWTVPLVREADGVRRALPGDGTAERLVALLTIDPSELGGPYRVTTWHHEEVQGERGVTVDQTNESIVVGERAVVKWSLHLPADGVPGSPAPQRLAALAAAGFQETPQPWGTLERVVDGVATLLAAVVEFLPGAQDGWDWMVDDVRTFARGDLVLDDALAPPKRLGMLTARMHAALAATGRGQATPAQAESWAARARSDLAEAAALVTGEEGDRLRARAARIGAELDVLATAAGTPLIDVHGDHHVGQVLRYGDPAHYAVTDFDGNPVLSPAERLERQPAAVDVAGMLASLDHVGRVVLFRTEGVDADAVRLWIDQAQHAFLHDYRDTLARMRAADLLDEALLLPLRLHQEVREYLYAVRHLPHWVYVPDLALADLIPTEE
ncbi:MAG: aminoglycoside phosphotransferase [Candidatus Nanopelagicales bacterium]